MPGVYISYPFCAQKCSFCNFASAVSGASARELYERKLMEEIERHHWRWTAETVYFGGGTPSLMPLDRLRKVLNGIPRISTAEITIECAPGSVTPERAQRWREAGVNRISLGVQSFIADELRETGRRHTFETVQNDVDTLRRNGISNINVDLIAGLPKQTEKTWSQSLDLLEALEVPHASVYIFEIDESSRLGKEILLGGHRYGATLLPSEDTTATLYETAVNRLKAMGLEHYEISNFARIGFESQHNLKYWQLEPYAGFGLDAHSFDGKYRYSNSGDLQTYLNATEHVREITLSDTSEEKFFVGLRLLRGIRPSVEEWSRFREPVNRWIDAGMLERELEWLRLSRRGILVSNEILQDFINV